MPTLYELIQSEYKTEYISEYTKLKELMEKKNSWDNTKQKVLYNLNFVKIREIRGELFTYSAPQSVQSVGDLKKLFLIVIQPQKNVKWQFQIEK